MGERENENERPARHEHSVLLIDGDEVGVSGKPDDGGSHGKEGEWSFPGSPDSDIRDVVVASQGSSTCFPWRHTTRTRVVTMTIGTAVQIVMTVRSDRSGDIVSLFITTKGGEKAEPFNLFLSESRLSAKRRALTKSGELKACALAWETNRCFVIVGRRGTDLGRLAVRRASRGGRAELMKSSEVRPCCSSAGLEHRQMT